MPIVMMPYSIAKSITLLQNSSLSFSILTNIISTSKYFLKKKSAHLIGILPISRRSIHKTIICNPILTAHLPVRHNKTLHIAPRFPIEIAASISVSRAVSIIMGIVLNWRTSLHSSNPVPSGRLQSKSTRS